MRLQALFLPFWRMAAYRRRRSESAGDIVSVRWAKVLFRYGVALTAALTIGQGLYGPGL